MENINPLVELVGFSGINTDFIPERLPPEDRPAYLTDAENVLVKDGMIEKLRGTGYLNDLATVLGSVGYEKILALPIYRKYDQTKYLLAITPRKVYALGASAWTEIGSITAGGNESAASFVNLDNLAILCVSDDGEIKKWDGTTFANLVDPATIKARFVVGYKTWLFLLRTIESGAESFQRVWPSFPGDPDSFNSDDQLDLDSEGIILGGRRMEDSVIVYTDTSIHQVYLVSDTEGFTDRTITHTLGLLSWRTLCGNKDSHFFLSAEGLMRMRTGTAPVSLSKEKYNRLIINEIDPLYRARAVAHYEQGTGLLYVSYPKAGYAHNNVQLIVDAESGELVSKKTVADRNISCYGSYEKDLTGMSADERRQYGVGGILLTGDVGGQVREQLYAEYQDVDAAFESSVTTPPLFGKSKKLNKRLLQMDLLIEKLTDEDITFIIDIANEANEVFDYAYTVTGDGDEGIRHYTVYIDVFGKEFRVKLSDSANIYGFKLHGIGLYGYYSGEK